LDEINQFENTENPKNFSTANKNYVKINNNVSLSNNNNSFIKNAQQNKKLNNQFNEKKK
jgi:hypothetical protein